jgi:hypothetical protein
MKIEQCQFTNVGTAFYLISPGPRGTPTTPFIKTEANSEPKLYLNIEFPLKISKYETEFSPVLLPLHLPAYDKRAIQKR